MLSPNDPDVIYAASEVVWKSTDHGRSWTIISPDLTRNDKSKQQPSGGPLTKDITSVEYYDTIFTLAESPKAKGMLWAGSDDGLVHLTRDDGAHWADVTPRDLPQWSTISMVEPSPHDAEGAYIAVDRHKLDDIKPYAWKTADGGKTWTNIAAGLPDGAVVHAVREDPVRRGLLFAGTELGVFVSFDDGAPMAAAEARHAGRRRSTICLVKGDDLVVATHGRAFWILDDITPLRQIGPRRPAQEVVLYTPEVAKRLHYPGPVDSRRPVGENPPAGALIDYALKTEPKGELTVDILNDQGVSIRHLSSLRSTKEVQPPEWPDQIVPDDRIPAKAGMNRLVWDLRMNDPVQIPGAFYSDSKPRGYLVPPGSYTVKLSVDGKTLTAPLTVVVDPRAPGSEPAIREKTALAMQVWDDIDALHKAVNGVRKARAELARAKTAAAAKPSGKALVSAAEDLDRKLATLEGTLMQVNMKGSEANLAFPGMLNEQYASFQGAIDDADTPPTAQELSMYKDLHGQLEVQLAAWKALQSGGLDAFNKRLQQASVTPVELAGE